MKLSRGPRMTDKEVRRLMRTRCLRCGETFGHHAADPPHARGDECGAYTAPADAVEEVRLYDQDRVDRMITLGDLGGRMVKASR